MNNKTGLWWFITGRKEDKTSQEVQATLDAISKSQAMIEFNIDGTIITANNDFLEAVGYTLEELKGKHHSILVDAQYKSSEEYKIFWDKLRRGEYDQAVYSRWRETTSITVN
jgi:methyl-accepting chemotaxis protein